MKAIDLTPTWGEVGGIVKHLIVSEEGDALKHLLPDMARAFAMAEALKSVLDTLDDRQHDIVAIRIWLCFLPDDERVTPGSKTGLCCCFLLTQPYNETGLRCVYGGGHDESDFSSSTRPIRQAGSCLPDRACPPRPSRSVA